MRTELLLAFSLMLALTSVGVSIVEGVQLHALNNEAEVMLTPYRAQSRFQRPRLCASLYNTDNHHAWAKCMGVEYR